MNKVLTTIASAVGGIMSLCLFSCDSNDSFPSTGVDGRPSMIRINKEESTSFAYDGKLLSKQKEEYGSTLHYKYENGELVSRNTTPPEGVMDGHGWTGFTRKENKIKVERSGEPSFELYTEEIKLNESGLPVKISDMGVFQNGPNGLIQIAEGRYFALFTYDSSTQQLVKQEVYNLKDSTLTATYTYEYDRKPGMMSRVDCPVWYAIWNSYRNSYSQNFSNLYFLNYRNNVIQIKIEYQENNKFQTVAFSYQYNSNDFPVFVSGTEEKDERIEIRY